MNRIFNWIFGSFFRTIGRVLVYILLGFVLFNLVNLKDIKLPKFTDLLFINVSAETFTNNNYMTWQLNKNGTRLNSGNNPFYTSVDNLTDYGNYDLYLFYNNYTAYNNYFYDVSLTIYFDNPFIFANRVRECNIYVEGSTNQKSDGCRVVDFTNTSLTIANYNIQTLTGTGTFTSQFIVPVYQNNEYTVFQVNSFKLDIVAKEDKSITSETFGNAINNVIDSQNNNANNIINNQNSNAQSIIDNQNQNKQDIIDNQNANTDKEIQSQQVCNFIDKNNISNDNKILVDSGGVINNNDYGITDYISLNTISKLKVSSTGSFSSVNNSALCFYNVNKGLISCIKNNSLIVNNEITIPTNTSFVRFSIRKNDNQPQFEICKNGNQAMSDSLNDMNSSINNSDISGASSDASNFFSNFTTDTHGLTGIITAPLNAINNLTNQTCSPLVLPLPFVDRDLTLPCMRDIYVEHFGSFMTLYDVISLGIVSYWVMVRIFSLVKDFKNPEHDEIEVVDL